MQVRLARIDYGKYRGTNYKSPHPTVVFEVGHGDEALHIPIQIDLREAGGVDDDAIIAAGRRRFHEFVATLSDATKSWGE